MLGFPTSSPRKTTLTKALQKSFLATSSDADAYSAELVESLFAQRALLQTPTPSGGSEKELAQLQKLRRGGVVPTGRVAKRKSRASKRAITTFITADPANLRQMVQQVTGVRFGGLNGNPPVVKPEPHTTIHRLQPSSVLPTLDAPNFFNDGSAAPSVVAQQHTPSVVTAGLDFDSFCSFPTVES